MFRKLVVGGMTLGTAAGILFGADTFSYLKTFGSSIREAVRSEITPEFELNRIQGEVDGLMPEIQEHLKVVAEQSVDAKDMDRSIQEKQGQLEKQRLAIMAIRSDLESGRESLTYHGISYTRNEVQTDLAQRFESYRVLETSLERDRQILTAQRTTLRANQQKLDVMLTRKQDLAVKVAQLEARLKQVQAAEAVSNVEIDDTRLAHVEKMIRELDRTLDVRQTMLETEGHITGVIPVDEPQKPSEDSDILSQIDSHFGTAKETPVSIDEPKPAT
jgi:chromosome segregation ATPase